MIKFQLLATEVGNTNKTRKRLVGRMDFQQWLGTGVPPVTVRGLDHRTEDYSLHPLQHKAGTIPYWTVPNKINPVVGATNHPLSRNIYKGHLDRGIILSCLGMTHLTLLHIPWFSVIPIWWGLRLSVTFRTYLLRMPIALLTMFHKHSSIQVRPGFERNRRHYSYYIHFENILRISSD